MTKDQPPATAGGSDTQEVSMRPLNRIALVGALMGSLAGATMGQEGESETAAANRTMRPIVRGQHFSVAAMNAEGTAPHLATIEWYKEHNGGKLPVNDSLLSGTVPGCIDAWYILLDRWGTMSFGEVLKEAIDLAGNGFPAGDSFARAAATSQKIRK